MRLAANERFWAKVHVTGPDDCWLWQGATKGIAGKKYGNFWRGRPDQRHIGAHVYSWELANGSSPKGKWVLHRCDVKLCVNPRHLFAGDVVANNHDMMQKDRVRFGSDHWNAVITEDDIGWIFARLTRGERKGRIAKSLNIAPSTLTAILIGRTWRRAPRTFDPRAEQDSAHDAMRRERVRSHPYLSEALIP